MPAQSAQPTRPILDGFYVTTTFPYWLAAEDGQRVSLQKGDQLIFEVYALIGIQMRIGRPGQKSLLAYCSNEASDSFSKLLMQDGDEVTPKRLKVKSAMFANLIGSVTRLQARKIADERDKQVYELTDWT